MHWRVHHHRDRNKKKKGSLYYFYNQLREDWTMEKSKGTTAAAATAAAAAVVADIRFIAKAKRAACAKRPFFALVTTDVKRKRHSSECCRLVT